MEKSTDSRRLALTTKEKHDYIRAVDCMFTSPAQTDPGLAGTKVRFDDFAAQHINQTLSIHVTVCWPLSRLDYGPQLMPLGKFLDLA
jgi:hypothetical protein